ncbi:MAG: hypothetical protein RIR76_1589 [Verrucomicrobiota bacterium]|jgi:uncharacterized protein (DUF1684 family)
MLLRPLALLLALCGFGPALAGAPTPVPADVQAARAARLEKLTAPDGWLTLVGLHFLPEGESTLGSDRGNRVVLAAGPARLGRVVPGPDRVVIFHAEPRVDARVEGREVRTVSLSLAQGAERPTIVTCGTVSFFTVERGGRLALRVKDSAAPLRTRFPGIEYHGHDPALRVEARWVEFSPPRSLPVTSVLGHVSPEPAPGKAVFEYAGRTWELMPFDEGKENPLFFVLADATTGRSTYGGGRFLYTPWPVNGRLVLDFNLAENPPCAFTPHSTCPLPPKENKLPFAIEAGEKTFVSP